MNRQRQVIYGERREVLEGADIEAQVRTFLDDVGRAYVHATTEGYAEDWDLDALWVALRQLYPVAMTVDDVEGSRPVGGELRP
jgi:preprotein translocase subunit SecA